MIIYLFTIPPIIKEYTMVGKGEYQALLNAKSVNKRFYKLFQISNDKRVIIVIESKTDKGFYFQ